MEFRYASGSRQKSFGASRPTSNDDRSRSVGKHEHRFLYVVGAFSSALGDDAETFLEAVFGTGSLPDQPREFRIVWHDQASFVSGWGILMEDLFKLVTNDIRQFGEPKYSK